MERYGLPYVAAAPKGFRAQILTTAAVSTLPAALVRQQPPPGHT
jgi:hypothetical protein